MPSHKTLPWVFLVPLVVTAATGLYLLAAKGYPWQLALLSSMSIGAFLYSAGRTVERRFWVLPTLRLTREADVSTEVPGNDTPKKHTRGARLQ